MTSTTQNKLPDLWQILVAVAWIDGEIQPEEQSFLEKIAAEQNIIPPEQISELIATHQSLEPEHCQQLLEQYLGANPQSQDYEELLIAVSGLVYSDSHIATEEAAVLNKIQQLDPLQAKKQSALDQAIAKIQTLYQAGLQKSKL